MTITERIFVTLAQKDLNQKEFAREIGVNEKTVSAWKKNNSLPPLDKISNISDCLGVSVHFLLTGEEESASANELTADECELLKVYNSLSDVSKARVKERAEVLAELEKLSQVQDDRVIEQRKPETRYIEYSTLKVSAGTGQYLDTGLTEQLKIVKNDITADASFAVKITGDSMEPLYEDGEIVLVKSQPTVELGEVGIFIVGGLGYIKKLGKDRLISVNPNYDDILFHEWDEIYCKGLVVGVLEDDDIVD